MVFLYRKFENETKIFGMSKKAYGKLSMRDERIGLIITANFEKLSHYKDFLGENLILVHQLSDLR